MFYTGARRTEARDRAVHRLRHLTRPRHLDQGRAQPGGDPDPGIVETLTGTADSDSFRDPWVMRDPDRNGWHMLITTRAATGLADDRGVVGHAWSADLTTWTVRDHLSRPDQGFPILEVPQLATIEGRDVLVFSCPAEETSPRHPGRHPRGDIWVVHAGSPIGPFDIAGAYQLVDDDSYSGRLVQDRTNGRWLLIAFDRNPGNPSFCTIRDPRPVTWRGDRLVVVDR